MANAIGITAAGLRELIAAWQDCYEITHDAMWHAKRKDNGAAVHAATGEELIGLVMDDWLAKPIRGKS
jgi:hypothetical protein